MNLYEARDFISNNYPGLSFEESFPESCIHSLTTVLCEGCIPLFSQARANKVQFLLSDGKKVVIPIKSHIFPVETKACLQKYVDFPIHINDELIVHLKHMLRAKHEGYSNPFLDEADKVLLDLETKYNRSKKEINTLLALKVIDEEAYKKFKLKNKLV